MLLSAVFRIVTRAFLDFNRGRQSVCILAKMLILFKTDAAVREAGRRRLCDGGVLGVSALACQ